MMEVRLSFLDLACELMSRPLYSIQSIMEAFLQVSYCLYKEVS
jgi:hypothetical protein